MFQSIKLSFKIKLQIKDRLTTDIKNINKQKTQYKTLLMIGLEELNQ
jgi:hypothetical protein